MPRASRPGRDADAMARLARLLGGSPAVEREVAAAKEQPGDYARAHESRLARLGVSAGSPPADLAWIVLVDESIRLRRAVAVDWRASPQEVARDLRRLHEDVGGVSERCLRGTLRTGSASAFLACVARELETEGRVLARIDPRPGDTAVVVLLDRGDFREAAALARQSGTGRVVAVTAEPLAEPPRPKAARTGPAKGSWQAVLEELGAGNVHALLLKVAAGEISPDAVAPHAARAPAAEREVIRAMLAFVAGERLSPRTPAQRVSALEAIRYAALLRGRELDALRALVDILHDGGGARAGVKERRAAVQTLRFGTAADRGRTAFARLDEPDRAFLRGLVSAQLDSKEVPALMAALDAARVVGNGELTPKVKALTQHASMLVAREARETMRVLSRT